MNNIPEEIIRRYAFKNKLCFSDASSVFDELELFLTEAASKSASPSERVDSAWHEFILHTKHYANYCQSRYGFFIHHFPLSPVLNEGSETDDEEKKKDGCGSGQSDG